MLMLGSRGLNTLVLKFRFVYFVPFTAQEPGARTSFNAKKRGKAKWSEVKWNELDRKKKQRTEKQR